MTLLSTEWVLRRSRFFPLSLSAILSACGSVHSAEIIDLSFLGSRGVTFEAPYGVAGFRGAQGLGDIDGDGFDDVGLNTRVASLTALSPFALILIYGRQGIAERQVVPGTLDGNAVFRVTPGFENGSFVGPVAIGDVNGDGFADFSLSLPTLPFSGPGGELRGKSCVAFGGPHLKGEFVMQEIGEKPPGLVFFSSDFETKGLGPLVPIGDFNGDGSADYAMGASNSTNRRGENDAGAVFVFYDVRSLSSPVDLAKVGTTIDGLRIDGTARLSLCCNDPMSQCECQTLGNLGRGILGAGDTDGDGFDDMLVTAQELSPQRVYLIRGGARLPGFLDLAEAENLENVITFLGPHGSGNSLFFANADGMAGLGDLNGDGFADFALGVYRGCCFGPDEGPVLVDGAVYLFQGRPDFPRLIDLTSISEDKYWSVVRSTPITNWFGSHVAAVDLNQDGIRDLVIGAPQADPRGMENAGEAYLVYLARDLPREISIDNGAEWVTFEGEGERNALGGGVHYAGDFNGDGHPDVLLMALQLTETGDPSRAYLIYGTGSEPQPLKLHTVVPPWGTVRGGTKVILNGSGFEGKMAVFLGDRPAASVTRLSRSQLSFETPPGAKLGHVDVTVRLDGLSLTLPQAFEYTPSLPRIDLRTLGDGGFILDAEPGRFFTWPAISALAFGDQSGDGIDDLVVEAASNPNGWFVTVVRGGGDLPFQLLACDGCPRTATIVSFVAHTTEGATVSFVGDVDGEGRNVLAIGASDAMGYLLLIPPFDMTGEGGIVDIDAAVASGGAVRFMRSDAFYPVSMLSFARTGDLTGDGVEDFAVGFPGAEVAPTGSRTGEIVFVAGRGFWPAEVDLSDPSSRFARIHGSRGGHSMAINLRAVGDVNSDGVEDFLAGTLGALKDRGRAYLLYGSKQLPEDIDVDTYVSGGGGIAIDLVDGFEHFNWFNISGAGDVNADGFSDVLLGVEGGGTTHQGVTYLIYGARDLPNYLEVQENPQASDGIVRIIGEGSLEQAGRPGPAGDYNVDGYADFVIGAPGFQQFGVEAGNVFLVFGGKSLPERIDLRRLGSHGLKIEGRNILGGTGFFAGPSGDFNGDGLSDFAFSEGAVRQGDVSHVYVVYNPFGGVEFIRGDSNFDGEVNIADAVFSLTYLFLGGVGPRCEDALDADDSGSFEITDAIRLLNFLFLGTVPAPHPQAGGDPTADGLRCLGF